MFIIDFIKSLFSSKQVEENKKSTQAYMPSSYSLNNSSEESISIINENTIPDSKLDVNNNDNISTITTINTEEENSNSEYIDQHIYIEHEGYSDIDEEDEENDSVIQDITEEYEEEIDNEEEKKEPLISSKDEFTILDIATIKDILRPIVRGYNYQNKDIYVKNTNNIKILKCFITSSANDKLLIFRPTQSDSYNKTISTFVRKYIFKDFSDALVRKDIYNLLDVESSSGKILIRKKKEEEIKTFEVKFNNTADY